MRHLPPDPATLIGRAPASIRHKLGSSFSPTCTSAGSGSARARRTRSPQIPRPAAVLHQRGRQVGASRRDTRFFSRKRRASLLARQEEPARPVLARRDTDSAAKGEHLRHFVRHEICGGVDREPQLLVCGSEAPQKSEPGRLDRREHTGCKDRSVVTPASIRAAYPADSIGKPRLLTNSRSRPSTGSVKRSSLASSCSGVEKSSTARS